MDALSQYGVSKISISGKQLLSIGSIQKAPTTPGPLGAFSRASTRMVFHVVPFTSIPGYQCPPVVFVFMRAEV
ncbi:hypothetical protein PBCV1_a095R [Paramecium bursaria Chlorella virus 1]|uniref:Uncharacterized protein n=1 Tax=Paramecium bursaria Chlorella virus 1 TaxID=10506 RepID=Q84416_PBCV1|nr:hypothetical protein PBCV1_a095R [Paramecium bursaria Chlorella virus 1]AAC96463.1 hypothetical protein [Paramecium bursaria Chlorella virus 1]